MRTFWFALLLSACGPARSPSSHAPSPSPLDAAPPPSTGAGVVASDPGGTVTIDGDTVRVVLAGVKSVASEPCRDDASFQVQAGAGWTDVIQRIHDKVYVLDGNPEGPTMCDDSPCRSNVPGADDVTLDAALTGFVKTGTQDGRPAYQTTPLHGRIKVTFSYSTDQCATWKTYTTTIDHP